MLFWTIILALTAAAVMSVLLPLGRAPKGAALGAESGRAVYLDQLAELARDRAENRVSPEDAEAARAEIGRRLIALEKQGDAGELRAADPAGRRIAAILALAGIPLFSVALYLALGAPALPGQPLASRLAAPGAETDVAALLLRVEEHLARAPEDGQGWDVIAPVYLRVGRPGDAARAYRNAIRLLGSSAARQTGLGEAILAAQGGVVTAEAREAFAAARAEDPASPAPRFFLALAREQEGDVAGATEGYRSLLAEAPAGAPWRGAVEEALARLNAAPAPSGPTAEDIAAAATMSPEDRNAMIEGMVGRLADRLAEQPDDVEGWLRLVRAYVVLGRPADAQAAARSALGALSGPEDQQRVHALAADLGLRLGETGPP